MFTRSLHKPPHCPNGRCANRTIARRNPRSPYWWSLVGFVILFLSAGQGFAGHKPSDEPYNTGWSFQFDNDLFARNDRDQDYTGGFIVTLSGRRAAEYQLTPNRARAHLDALFGLNRHIDGRPHRTRHALEWGAALFTPVDISASDVNEQDRPYASLFFLNSTVQHVLPAQRKAIKSELTFGLLGLPLAGTLQREFHNLLGNTKPQGWNNQISAGGEPTLKYSISTQRAAFQVRHRNGLAQEFNWTGKLNLGFSTGLGAGFNWRYGRINTPWWSFNPHQSDYVNFGANIAPSERQATRVPERYVYAGGTLNLNAYNAFVEGQFRRSTHRVDRSDIVPGTAELWVGASYETDEHLRVDAFVRARTRELRLSDSVPLAWGGLIVSRAL